MSLAGCSLKTTEGSLVSLKKKKKLLALSLLIKVQGNELHIKINSREISRPNLIQRYCSEKEGKGQNNIHRITASARKDMLTKQGNTARHSSFSAGAEPMSTLSSLEGIGFCAVSMGQEPKHRSAGPR